MFHCLVTQRAHLFVLTSGNLIVCYGEEKKTQIHTNSMSDFYQVNHETKWFIFYGAKSLEDKSYLKSLEDIFMVI